VHLVVVVVERPWGGVLWSQLSRSHVRRYGEQREWSGVGVGIGVRLQRDWRRYT
jgi:hypothetical protein